LQLTIASSLRSPEAAIPDHSSRELVSSFGRPPIVRLKQNVVLITGAGGSIGSSLAEQFCPVGFGPCQIAVFLDHSEQNLYELLSHLSSNYQKRETFVLGDVNDEALIDDLFDKHRPKRIFHAAAFKHVPLMEQNPIAVIRNNILGTWTLALAAIKYKSRKLVMVSTDKAADPRSIMGATKRVAELILSCLDSPETRMCSVRLCNVLGSTGSVVPLFERQIRMGGPVTVTHADASRYFVSVNEATKLILLTEALDDSGTLFVPEFEAPTNILDLARKMIAEAAGSSPKQIKMVGIGLRPGEKLTESLVSSSETVEPTAEPRLRRVCGSIPSVETLCAAIGVISEKVQARDLPALIDVIRSLVPEYQPSEALSALASAGLSTTAKA
jgi:FlaA1/EpsC-like NDP-sugar epimerase